MMAAAANLSAGLAAEFKSLTSGSTSNSHDHWATSNYTNLYYPQTTADLWYDPAAAGGSHTHGFTLAVGRNVKRYKLALYAGSGAFTVTPGIIMMWAKTVPGSPTLPATWKVCDGANGTPNLRDYFIEIAATGAEGTTAGDNTLSVSGNGTPVSHNHLGTSHVTGDYRTTNLGHGADYSHTHSISASAAYVPSYFALYFIMFTG